jgi:phosphatidylglycerophosphate synthase
MATVIFYGGWNFDEAIIPSFVWFLAAFAIFWFSWFDMMDGQRARRMKCGTPIGRIVDEAGDAI